MLANSPAKELVTQELRFPKMSKQAEASLEPQPIEGVRSRDSPCFLFFPSQSCNLWIDPKNLRPVDSCFWAVETSFGGLAQWPTTCCVPE